MCFLLLSVAENCLENVKNESPVERAFLSNSSQAFKHSKKLLIFYFLFAFPFRLFKPFIFFTMNLEHLCTYIDDTLQISNPLSTGLHVCN